MSAHKSALELARVSVRYPGGTVAVQDVSTTIESGEAVGLLGLNGAGKTTLARAICTLQPYDGAIHVFGLDGATQTEDVRRHLQIVLDNNQPIRPNWTVRTYLDFFQGLEESVSPADTARVQSVLGLGGLLERKIGHLSAGQRRRVELARAFASTAPLLVLDEPTRELDVEAKALVWDLMRQEAQLRGRTLVVLSHDILEIQSACDRALLLRHGEITGMLDGAKLKQLTPGSFIAALRGQ